MYITNDVDKLLPITSSGKYRSPKTGEIIHITLEDLGDSFTKRYRLTSEYISIYCVYKKDIPNAELTLLMKLQLGE